MILQQKQFAEAFMKNGFIHSSFAKLYCYAKSNSHFDGLSYPEQALTYI